MGRCETIVKKLFLEDGLLHVEAHNENYDLDFSPYIFDVSVQ